MDIGVWVTIALFVIGGIFSLVQFIVVNLFVKKIDEISKDVKDLTKELARQFEMFVLKQDHHRDMDEFRKRIDRLENKEQ